MQALLITGWPAMKCKYVSISVIRAPEKAGSGGNNKKNTTKKISKNQKSSKKKNILRVHAWLSPLHSSSC